MGDSAHLAFPWFSNALVALSDTFQCGSAANKQDIINKVLTIQFTGNPIAFKAEVLSRAKDLLTHCTLEDVVLTGVLNSGLPAMSNHELMEEMRLVSLRQERHS